MRCSITLGMRFEQVPCRNSWTFQRPTHVGSSRCWLTRRNNSQAALKQWLPAPLGRLPGDCKCVSRSVTPGGFFTRTQPERCGDFKRSKLRVRFTRRFRRQSLRDQSQRELLSASFLTAKFSATAAAPISALGRLPGFDAAVDALDERTAHLSGVASRPCIAESGR
jgi:hypothetical protein